MELRICDLRNAKFQGQTINKQPSGFGFVLDQNYSFIVGQISNGAYLGPVAVVFGDSSKLYGDSLTNSNGFIVYSDNHCKIFKNNKTTVMDIPVSQSLLKLQSIRDSDNNFSPYMYDVRVAVQRRYTAQNYLNLLNQLLGIKSIQQQYLSYQNFIKERFKNKYRSLVNIYQSPKQFGLSFRQEGLFIKLSKKPDLIISVGFESPGKKLEIGRKYTYFRNYTSCIVQQSIQTEPTSCVQFQTHDKLCINQNKIRIQAQNKGVTTPKSQYNERIPQNQQFTGNPQKVRTKQCTKNLREYYKRSLTFINKYLSLNKIYNVRFQLQSLFRKVLQMQNGAYAQVKLENNGYKIDQNNQPIITNQTKVKNNQATLSDWKRQIERTMGIGKRTGKTPSRRTQQTKYNEIQPIKFNFSPEKNKFEQLRKSRQKQKYQSPIKKIQEKPVRTGRLNPQKQRQTYNKNQRSKSHRQLKYLDSETDDQNQLHDNIKLYNNNRNDTRNHSPANRPQYPYKFKYTDDQGRLAKQQQKNILSGQKWINKYQNSYQNSQTPSKKPYNYSQQNFNHSRYTNYNENPTSRRVNNKKNYNYN